MQNVPVIKIGIVAVSRDCFPESLAERYTHYTKNMLQKQMSKNLVSSQ